MSLDNKPDPSFSEAKLARDGKNRNSKDVARSTAMRMANARRQYIAIRILILRGLLYV